VQSSFGVAPIFFVGMVGKQIPGLLAGDLPNPFLKSYSNSALPVGEMSSLKFVSLQIPTKTSASGWGQQELTFVF
jgi:hypothetical protein